MTNDSVLDEYAAHAADIAPMFEALSTADVLEPVARFLPVAPADIADVGAGTGRDAAWFAELGHRVVAVEPVAGLAAYGKTHHSKTIEWCDDTLPELTTLTATARAFDLILVGSVWHHLDEQTSLAALHSLGMRLKPHGNLIISLKEFANEGQTAATITASDLRQQFSQANLSLTFETRSDGHQSHNRLAGNTWVWFVVTKAQAKP